MYVLSFRDMNIVCCGTL